MPSGRMSNDLRYRPESDPGQVALTPEYILAPVRRAFGGTIDLDPCTTADNPVGALRFFCPPQDGAEQAWSARSVYVNPPYGKVRERWVERCIRAGEDGLKVILLMPAATDTKIFQAAARSASWIAFVKGRLKFGVLRPNRRQVAASHPSAVFGWNCPSDPFDEIGTVMTNYGKGMVKGV